MKKNLKKKAGIFLCLIILLYNVVWFYNFTVFHGFTDGLNEFKKFATYSVLEDNYVYHVKYPDYLSFTGNLAVATSDNEYVLIIWISRFEETKYGVMVPAENDRFVSVMIDRELNAESIYDQKYIDDNKKEIQELFDRAYKRWGNKFE